MFTIRLLRKFFRSYLRGAAAVPTTAVPTAAIPTTAVPTTAIPTTTVPTTASKPHRTQL